MFSREVVESLSEMCRDQQLSFISGEFKAYRDKNIESNNEESAGVVKAIVTYSGHFVFWLMDTEHGVLTGTCSTPKGQGRFIAGKEIPADIKKAMIEEIMDDLFIDT